MTTALSIPRPTTAPAVRVTTSLNCCDGIADDVCFEEARLVKIIGNRRAPEMEHTNCGCHADERIDDEHHAEEEYSPRESMTAMAPFR